MERFEEKLEREIMGMRVGEEKTIEGIKISIEKIRSEEIVWAYI